MIFRKSVLILMVSTLTAALQAGGVGLVLSGGGARGLAHIGVIRALEEHDIPIDYITGTSMGAIIGALYASGYTPDEMAGIVKSDEFIQWSTGRIPEKFFYYYKKRHVNPAMISFELRRTGSVIQPVLPTNIIPTHSIDLALLELFALSSAASGYDFNNLFIPFRCVASDVYNNRPHVLGCGDLASAVRASITYPFYFNPIKIDDIILFDGGIHNNFPFDVMMNEFSPRIMIGSKVSTNPPPPTVDNLRLQVVNMITARTDYDIEKMGGILIETENHETGVFDFQNYNKVIEKGYLSAMDKIEEILLAVEDRLPAEELNRRREAYRENLPAMIFQNINVRGRDGSEVDFVRKSIRQQEDYFTMDRLRAEYYKLVADDKIGSIYPRAVYNEGTGIFDLDLELVSEDQVVARFGGNLSTSGSNYGYASAEYRKLGAAAYNIDGNIYFGRFYNSVMARGKIEAPGAIPFFGDLSMVISRTDFFTNQRGIFFYESSPSNLIRYDGHLSITGGVPVGVNGLVKASYSAGRISDRYYPVKGHLHTDIDDRTDFDMGVIKLRYDMNTLNRRQFPTRGQNFHSSLRLVTGKESFYPGTKSGLPMYEDADHIYMMAKSNYTRFFRINQALSLGITGETVFSTQRLLNNYIATLLHSPAYLPFPQCTTFFFENYRAHNYMAAGLIPVIHFNDVLHVRLETHIFQPWNKIGRDERNEPFYLEQFKDRHIMCSARLVYHTPFGPASLGLNYYDNDGQKFYFHFNFGFLIFNPVIK